MRLSPWRLIHLWLAIVSGVFLLIASVTGLILSFEPLYEQSYGFCADADELAISELIKNVSDNYEDISSIRKDHNGYYQISILGGLGEETFYFDPVTGDRLGDLIKTPELFDFARTLHRSLFFKELGRFIVGVTSLVLVIIAIAGFFLVVRKQGGIKLFFRKVVKETFEQDYHTHLGKVFIWPVLIVSITGTVLFFKRFDVISTQLENHDYNFDSSTNKDEISFSVFETTQLKEFKELIFPFSDFEDDHYELKLTDRELLINQKTSEVLSMVDYSQGKLLADFSFRWHTGEGQSWWAIMLGFTSMSLIFFIYSGFSIYFKRKPSKSGWNNPYPLENCEIVIAVGSELGATAEKAEALHRSFLQNERDSFITSMNEFEYVPSMKFLILLTSTYGKGDAPANANRFIKKFNDAKELHTSFLYSVVGFGSRAYPDFCQYAIDLDNHLDKHESASQLLPLFQIDDKEQKVFDEWAEALSLQLDTRLEVEIEAGKARQHKLKVSKKEFSRNPLDHTFLLEFSAKKSQLKHLESGDLLAITPEDGVPRYYSMSVGEGKKSILLSVKKHEKGNVSNYLSNLEVREDTRVSFKKNPHFHFPDNASRVLLIANGTGIAPFLGMLESNHKKTPTTLYWGGQNEVSYHLYESRLDGLMQSGRLNQIQLAFSRVDREAKYVQELIDENEEIIKALFQDQGVVMICGSLKMLEGVEAALTKVTGKHLDKPIAHYKELGMVKSDCY